MKKRIAWLLVSGLMVLALVLASCGPAVTEEEEEEVVTEEEEEEEEVAEGEEEEGGPEMVLNAAGKLVEKPRYGGVFTGTISNVYFFDDYFGYNSLAPTLHLTNEDLLIGDWAKGPSGTGEASWLYYAMFPLPDIRVGGLIESWELADANTLVYHIRQGIHWHDKPPTNGREMTADDVAFSLARLWESPRSYQTITYPYLATMENPQESFTTPDKWTVVIKTASGRAGEVFEMASAHAKILPRDAVEMYGDLNNWENAIGTGPFMLTDYVRGSSATFVRNPNYWMKNPLHPENQLPYLDGVKLLEIPDASTQMAALRTGKIDLLGLNWENAEEVMRTNPELKYLRWYSPLMTVLDWRVDKPELPFYDIKVRQALAMAIDNQEILDTYYGGNGELLTWPVTSVLVEWADIHIPLNELPEIVQEMFGFHPDKAKQLLAEAGYPDGFKTEIVCTSTTVDLLSIVKAMWADVGVDLELVVKDPAVYNSMRVNKSYSQMIVMSGVSGALPFKFVYTGPGKVWNLAMVNDPVINEAYAAISAVYFDEPLRRQLMKDVVPYMLEQEYFFQFPGYYLYTFWSPWVKSYHGENTVGYTNLYSYLNYIWLDQDLKEEMTGTR